MSSCRTRYLQDDQALVTKVNVKGIDKQFTEQAALYVQKDLRPNSWLNLVLYNIFNTKHRVYRTDRLKKIGEAPHLVDSSLVEISRTQIEKFLRIKGFFNAKVNSDIAVAKKKGKITFTANPGPEFKIRDIQYIIGDSVVSTLVDSNLNHFTHVHKNQRYDLDSLLYDREQVYQLLRRNGYYDYLRQYMYGLADTNLSSSQVDLKFFLDNPAGKSAHQHYTINNSVITIKASDGTTNGHPDTVVIDSQYHFVDYSGKFKPQRLARFLFFSKGNDYSIDKEDLTYDRLYDLNVFRNIKIDYIKTPDSTNRLNPRVEIIPLKKMSNRIEGEYTFNSGHNGFNIGDTYTNRNLSGGGDLLELKVKYGVQFDATTQSLFGSLFSRDFQIGANYIVPKLLSPFRIPQLGKNGVPHTTFSTNLQLFDQKNAFTNRIFVNSLTYEWVETKYKHHSVTPINIEFRNGHLDPAFRDTLLNKGFTLYVKTNDRQFFNLGSQYAYTYNNLRLNTYGNFFYFRGSLDIGGNTLGLMNKLFKFKTDADGFRTVFGLRYQQYVKTEADIRMYRFLGGEKQFVTRLDIGIGLPYGNSKTLTFEKNFFAGGSNGVRAWQARTLGPGNYNRAVLASNELRTNLRNLDQLGELKMEGNVEYRFKMLNNLLGSKVKGALFTDFGNVWRLHKAVENPGGEFKFDKFLNQLAIGTGAGLRFDVNYFVFRFDAGLKVKDPQFAGSEQWVIKQLFNKKEFKARYQATNSPDVYRFIQYNFGIGMPF
ncbi:MAG TPA: BamA/TamA family outer membrane protein [Daejeonella sp.]|nr:BamA/TamA family outer membrane protein [Daejeonella sp.]